MNRQTISFFILILVLGSIGYVWYKYSRKAPEENTASSIFSETESALSEIRRLKNLELDTSILKDAYFQSLRIPDEAAAFSLSLEAVSGGAGTTTAATFSAGRDNPFLPF